MIAPPIALPRPVLARTERSHRSGWAVTARRKPLGSAALGLIVVIALLAFFANVLAPHDPTRIYPGRTLAPPGALAPNGVLFLLGADESGRDLLSRMIFGARISLEVGFLSVGIGTLVGTLFGLVSAF